MMLKLLVILFSSFIFMACSVGKDLAQKSCDMINTVCEVIPTTIGEVDKATGKVLEEEENSTAVPEDEIPPE